MENPTEIINIGIIDFYDDGGIATIAIHNNEAGELPHFHIQNEDRTIDSCLAIHEPKYLYCGTHKKILTPVQLRLLNDWLQEPMYPSFNSVSRWMYLAISWTITNPLNAYNMNMSKRQLSKTDQPDYRAANIQRERELQRIRDEKPVSEFTETDPVAVVFAQGYRDGFRDGIDRSVTILSRITSRYTVCKERGGMGQVEWADMLVRENEFLEFIEKYRDPDVPLPKPEDTVKMDWTPITHVNNA